MRCSAQVQVHLVLKALIVAGFAATLLLLWATMGSTTMAQAPRPTLTPVPPPTTAPAPSAAGPTGPTLKGRVINLATGETESDVTVVFTTGRVSVEVVTDESGEYALELGTANGVLNAIPPRESGLKPVTADVAVQPRTGLVTVVNLGVSPDGNGAPPLFPSVKVSPASARVGEQITITVLVKNTFSHAISGAMVTDWLPDGLVPVSVSSSTGNAYFSENMAIVEVGRLDAFSGALVEIVAEVANGQAVALASRSRVSFFFREDAAAQAQAVGNSSSVAPTVLPVTGVGLPLIGLALIAVVVVAGWLRRRSEYTLPAR